MSRATPHRKQVKHYHEPGDYHLLAVSGSRRLQRLTIRERPGREMFRYWQEGPGYDRILKTEKTVVAAIDYVHLNPVRRGLVKQAADWQWSGARWYLSDGKVVDPQLPTIHRPPTELFVRCR